MEDLKKQIQQKLESSHTEIILGVFQKSIQSHRGYLLNRSKSLNCDCEFCTQEMIYVQQKRQEDKHIKFLEYLWESGYSYSGFKIRLNDLLEAKENSKIRIRQLKEKKDAIKKLCN